MRAKEMDAEVVSKMLERLKENEVVKAVTCLSSRVAGFQHADSNIFISSFKYPKDLQETLHDTMHFKDLFFQKKFIIFEEYFF